MAIFYLFLWLTSIPLCVCVCMCMHVCVYHTCHIFIHLFIDGHSGCFLEKAMAPHSSTLAWKIPWMEEPGRLQSMGSRRVGHDWATSLSLSCIGEGNGNPLQCSCLENPRDGGAWWEAVYGVTQSRTWLKRLSSSSRLFPYLCFLDKYPEVG